MTILKIQTGDYYAVRDAEQLREIMAASYNRPISQHRSLAVFSGPYHDGFGFGKIHFR